MKNGAPTITGLSEEEREASVSAYFAAFVALDRAGSADRSLDPEQMSAGTFLQAVSDRAPRSARRPTSKG